MPDIAFTHFTPRESDDLWPPKLAEFANALQIWSFCQQRETTIHEASLMFNVPLDLIKAAVEAHGWMYLDGTVIGHEGE